MMQVVWTLLNVEAMPNRDPSVQNGLRSVTEGKVTVGIPSSGGLQTIMCVKHGAMLRVGEKLWRCPTCNEGAYTPDGFRHEPEQPRERRIEGWVSRFAAGHYFVDRREVMAPNDWKPATLLIQQTEKVSE